MGLVSTLEETVLRTAVDLCGGARHTSENAQTRAAGIKMYASEKDPVERRERGSKKPREDVSQSPSGGDDLGKKER